MIFWFSQFLVGLRLSYSELYVQPRVFDVQLSTIIMHIRQACSSANTKMLSRVNASAWAVTSTSA